MITEQEYLFETKVELLCKINDFKYVNIVKIMLLKQENLINKIINVENEENINIILDAEEMDLITNYYYQNLKEIEERIRLLCLIGNIDETYLEKEVMNSQDLIRRLCRQPIEKYVECLNKINKFDMNDANTKKIRLEESMKFLNKSLNDSIVKKNG